MAIYLIRHGETASNAARVLQFPDTPLSDNGLEQARRLGERLRGHPFARILVSDYARAHQTAQAVGRTTDAALEVTPLLRERNFGDLRGRPYAELEAEGIQPFGDDYHPPGGESWEDFHARVDDAWSHMVTSAEAAGGDIAVVTHGLVCSSVVLRKVTVGEGQDSSATGWVNTSLTVIERGDPWTATLVNCGAHLDEIRETGPA